MRDYPALPSIPYEQPNGPSLFELWEHGQPTAIQAPLAVWDLDYRAMIIAMLDDYQALGMKTLVSIGAGNGVMEAELNTVGWDVLATDCSDDALTLCRAKGLSTMRFCLTLDGPIGQSFDVIYCDGVMGHLWRADSNCKVAWKALAQLGCQDSLAIVSNDLAEIDGTTDFLVRSFPGARFYRPSAGCIANDALGTGLWRAEKERMYHYERRGDIRRRELLLMRLLMNEGVETEDSPKFGPRD